MKNKEFCLNLVIIKSFQIFFFFYFFFWMTAKCTTECYLTMKDILLWIKKDLCSILQSFPGPCSVVVFDNMPQHWKFEKPISKWINEKGAILLWNPPNSPDLNLIEKCWGVCWVVIVGFVDFVVLLVSGNTELFCVCFPIVNNCKLFVALFHRIRFFKNRALFLSPYFGRCLRSCVFSCFSFVLLFASAIHFFGLCLKSFQGLFFDFDSFFDVLWNNVFLKNQKNNFYGRDVEKC